MSFLWEMGDAALLEPGDLSMLQLRLEGGDRRRRKGI